MILNDTTRIRAIIQYTENGETLYVVSEAVISESGNINKAKKDTFKAAKKTFSRIIKTRRVSFVQIYYKIYYGMEGLEP